MERRLARPRPQPRPWPTCQWTAWWAGSKGPGPAPGPGRSACRTGTAGTCVAVCCCRAAGFSPPATAESGSCGATWLPIAALRSSSSFFCSFFFFRAKVDVVVLASENLNVHSVGPNTVEEVVDYREGEDSPDLVLLRLSYSARLGTRAKSTTRSSTWSTTLDL